MRLGWAKTKYSVSYFVKKTIYVNGKNKDLVIKRLGSEKQICENMVWPTQKPGQKNRCA